MPSTFAAASSGCCQKFRFCGRTRPAISASLANCFSRNAFITNFKSVITLTWVPIHQPTAHFEKMTRFRTFRTSEPSLGLGKFIFMHETPFRTQNDRSLGSESSKSCTKTPWARTEIRKVRFSANLIANLDTTKRTFAVAEVALTPAITVKHREPRRNKAPVRSGRALCCFGCKFPHRNEFSRSINGRYARHPHACTHKKCPSLQTGISSF